MRKSIILYLCTMMMSLLSLTAQNTFTYFNKMRLVEGTGALSSVAKPISDGYLVLGVNGGASSKFFIEKIDKAGHSIWVKTITAFEKPGAIESGTEALITKDQHIVFIYDVDIGDGNLHDIALAKINFDGELIWNKRYSNMHLETSKEIIETMDGNFLILGHLYDGTVTRTHLIKVHQEGKLLWKKTFGHDLGPTYSFSIQETADLGYIIGGSSYHPETNFDSHLQKIDYWGNIEWEKTYGGVESDCAATVKIKDKGTHFTYLISGCIEVEEVDQYGRERWRDRMYQAEIDGQGDVIWEKIYTEFDPSTSTHTDIRWNHQGFILVADYRAWRPQPMVIQFDPFGHVLWSKPFIINLSQDYYIKDIEPTLDGRGYVMAGYQFSPLPQKSWVLTIDSLGNTCAGLNCDSTVVIPSTDVVGWSMPTPTELQLQVTPNPATDYLQLSYQLPTDISNPQLVLYNTVGQVVLQQAVPTTEGATIAIADLPAGVYVYALTDAQYRLLGKGKLVLE